MIPKPQHEKAIQVNVLLMFNCVNSIPMFHHEIDNINFRMSSNRLVLVTKEFQEFASKIFQNSSATQRPGVWCSWASQ